jgi:cellulose synthase (UDP-forming)
MPMLAYGVIALSLGWLGRGLWWPIITPASQLFAAIRTMPTVITSLLKPYGTPLLRLTRVTPKGSLAQGSGTDWETLAPLLLLIGGILAGMVDGIVFGRTVVTHPDEVVAALGWTGLTLIHLTLAALACVERPYRRSEERFTLGEHAHAVAAVGEAMPVKIEDLSLGGGRLRFEAPQAIAAGAQLSLAKEGVGLLPCDVVRVLDQGRVVAVRFAAMEGTLRGALIRQLFLNREIQAEPDRFSRRRVIGQIWERCLRAGP